MPWEVQGALQRQFCREPHMWLGGLQGQSTGADTCKLSCSAFSLSHPSEFPAAFQLADQDLDLKASLNTSLLRHAGAEGARWKEGDTKEEKRQSIPDLLGLDVARCELTL